jgi:hypothetical protein
VTWWYSPRNADETTEDMSRLHSFIILCLATAAGCNLAGDSAAVVVVDVGSVPIFFKSYKWGMNGYSAVLSLDPDSTKVPRPRQWECCPGDYDWPADSPHYSVFKVEGGVLHIGDTRPTGWKPPRVGPLGPLVTFHEVDVSTENRMRDHPESFGVYVLDDADLSYEDPPVAPVPFSQVQERSVRRRKR